MRGVLAFALVGGLALTPTTVTAHGGRGDHGGHGGRHRGHHRPPAVEEREWFVDESKLPFDAPADPFDPTKVIETERSWGVLDGAGYRIEVPPNWNGDLVVWAHGYRGEGLELTVDNHPLRQYLVVQGYAWVASSYSKNGYAPGQGAIDTYKLIKKFKRQVGRPDRTYMTGASMGGHVTGYAIQEWPHLFDGAMPICGVMGDSELFDYFQDTYLLAEYFAGNDVAVPTPDDYYVGQPAPWQSTVAQLGPGFPVVLNEQGELYKSAIEQLTGGDRPVFDEGWVGPVGALFPFLFGVATTDDGRENKRTVYQLDSDPAISDEEAMLNELIPRIKPDKHYRQKRGINRAPDSENDSPYLNGRIEVPVLSLHTLGELFVPFHMQQIYAERVEKRGRSHLLVQRAIRDVNHCGFDPAETIAAFDDLVTWVEDGVRPAGDDVLDPAVVADPQFGCRFTAVQREGVAACAVP